MFKAEIIAASRNTHGQRLTTFLITFPRYILAEVNTHRMLSRNTASSRAIPFKKMLKMVEQNMFIPLKFQKDHSGMQGTEYFEGADADFMAMDWKTRGLKACMSAEELHDRGLTKQLCNRIIEPFAWCTQLISGTEWENFFALRASPHAEIHMAHLAELMLEAYNNAKVYQLQPGDWHIPFGDVLDFTTGISIRDGLKICTARCAQTSYTLLGDDEKPMDYPKLIALHDRLISAKHMSPTEHCARAMDDYEYETYKRQTPADGDLTDPIVEYGWCKNYRGFIQYRQLIPGENQEDLRVRRD